jgi:hypothetical protein
LKRLAIFVIACLPFYGLLLAQQRAVEYRPGGDRFNRVWTRFYNGDHEPELDDPLIAAGKPMTLTICDAIKNNDMKYRRYAIGALGYIADKRALPELEAILGDPSELEYFRSDALHSIYQVDRNLGTSYAKAYAESGETLGLIAQAILKKEPWLLEPTEE